MKAVRAKKLLQKRAMLKEEKKALAMAAGVEWHSDDSDDDSPVIYDLLCCASPEYRILSNCSTYMDLTNWLSYFFGISSARSN